MWELLTNEATSHSWDIICQRLLEKPLLFWEDLMQQLFLERLQVRRSHGPAAFRPVPSGLLSLPESVLSLLTESGVALLDHEPQKRAEIQTLVQKETRPLAGAGGNQGHVSGHQ